MRSSPLFGLPLYNGMTKYIDIQKKGNRKWIPFLAVRTGLEPVTPCVTGMYSNQLN